MMVSYVLKGKNMTYFQYDLSDSDPNAPPDWLIDPDHPAYAQGVVEELRRELWDNGFSPIPVYNHNLTRLNGSEGKRPKGSGWQDAARQNPPKTVSDIASHDALNTGILCDGLRAVDIDIKSEGDEVLAEEVYGIVVRHLGAAPNRVRAGSTSRLYLYRAAVGEPRKRAISDGVSGGRAIEILGFGQQFVGFGTHKSGAELVWPHGSPLTHSVADLPGVTESQIDAMLAEIAPLIGADIAQLAADRARNAAVALLPPMVEEDISREDVASAVAAMLPDDGHDTWVKALAAIYNATGGSADGLALAHEYSRKGVYDRKVVDRKWRAFSSSPMRQMGVGTLFHLARQGDPDWVRPSSQQRPQRKDDGLAEVIRAKRAASDAKKSGRVEDAAPDLEPASFVVAPVTAGPMTDLFSVLTVDDLDALPPPKWLIPELLSEETLAVMFAPPSCLKSFLAVDLGMRLAYGLPWVGNPCERQGVAYIAAEGAAGIGKRTLAWRKHNNQMGVGNLFRMIPATVNLLDVAEVDRLIRTIEAQQAEHGFAFRLVIVDTLARSIVGADENGYEAMSRAIAGADRIQKTLRCTVLVVHHSGKDVSRGPRGHGSLSGAADTILAVSRDKMKMTVLVQKQKDDEDGYEIGFRAEKIILPDRNGKPCSSLILEHEPDDKTGSTPMLKMENQKTRRDILARMRKDETMALGKIAKLIGMHPNDHYKAKIADALPLNESIEVRDNAGNILGTLRRFLDPNKDDQKFGSVLCDQKF